MFCGHDDKSFFSRSLRVFHPIRSHSAPEITKKPLHSPNSAKKSDL
jgi:hypothetical protein